MSPESKMVYLAAHDTAMAARFGSSPFRMCEVPLVQNFLPRKIGDNWTGGGRSAVRFRRVTSTPMYAHDGRNALERLYFQFDVLDFLADEARVSANVLKGWLEQRANFVTGEQFASPPQTPRYFANFQANEMTGTEPQSNPLVYVSVLEFWLWFSSQN